MNDIPCRGRSSTTFNFLSLICRKNPKAMRLDSFNFMIDIPCHFHLFQHTNI